MKAIGPQWGSLFGNRWVPNDDNPKKKDVESRYGAWTAHNIHLQDDIYTIAPRVVGDGIKLRRIVQIEGTPTRIQNVPLLVDQPADDDPERPFG